MSRERGLLVGLFIGALCTEALTAWIATREIGIRLSALGVYFDGHLYLEIARSFPLPYADAGLDYLTHAPGYPALIYLGRWLTPDAVNWGALAMLAAWIPGAACVPAFYLLCKQVGAPPFWGSILFFLANPRWFTLSATPHPEPLAMLLVIAFAIAYLRGSLPFAALWLSLAVWVRFPTLLLIAPMAFGVLLVRGAWTRRNFALLACPVFAFGSFHAYLRWRAPEFAGFFETHRVFWDTDLVWPFQTLWRIASQSLWPKAYPFFELTYLSVAFYLVCALLGFRARDRALWIFPVWILAIVIPHVSLSGTRGALDFTRLVVLAWPAAFLILWRLSGKIVSGPAAGVAAAILGALSLGYAALSVPSAVSWQARITPFLRQSIRHIDRDEPRWVDFRGLPDVAAPRSQRE